MTEVLYAIDNQGQKVLPSPKGRSACPGCGGDMIAKCGEDVAHHWAHVPGQECGYAAGETDWHLSWKRVARPENCEVNRVAHCADLVLESGLVLEFQHSSISPDDVRKREAFYGKMEWIYDARTADLKFFETAGDLYKARWEGKKPQFLNTADKPVILHCCDRYAYKFVKWVEEPGTYVKDGKEYPSPRHFIVCKRKEWPTIVEWMYKGILDASVAHLSFDLVWEQIKLWQRKPWEKVIRIPQPRPKKPPTDMTSIFDDM